jgi:hypothetical protein
METTAPGPPPNTTGDPSEKVSDLSGRGRAPVEESSPHEAGDRPTDVGRGSDGPENWNKIVMRRVFPGRRGRNRVILPRIPPELDVSAKSYDETERNMRSLSWLNAAVTRNLRAIEMIGVLMRIFSFSLVSWLGPASPFLFVWAFNTADAIMLSWCAIIKKDRAYTLLNVFWIGVGVVGMIRAAGFAHA